jgi:hypothetical protein
MREQHGELAVHSLCWFGLVPVTSKFGENRNLGPLFQSLDQKARNHQSVEKVCTPSKT